MNTKKATQLLTTQDFYRHAEPFSRLSAGVNRATAVILAVVQNWPITANMFTLASLLFGLSSLLFLFLWQTIWGFTLSLWLSFALDTADGMWARAKKQASPFGKWFDAYSDYVKDFVIDLGLLWNFVLSEDEGYLLVMLFLVIKALFYLLRSGFKSQLRDEQVRNIPLLAFAPAEKYLILWPIVALMPFLVLPVYLGFGLMYVVIGVNLVSRVWQGKLG